MKYLICKRRPAAPYWIVLALLLSGASPSPAADDVDAMARVQQEIEANVAKLPKRMFKAGQVDHLASLCGKLKSIISDVRTKTLDIESLESHERSLTEDLDSKQREADRIDGVHKDRWQSLQAEFTALQARTDEHNRRPHTFRLPDEQAAANAYDEEASLLSRQGQQLTREVEDLKSAWKRAEDEARMAWERVRNDLLKDDEKGKALSAGLQTDLEEYESVRREIEGAFRTLEEVRQFSFKLGPAWEQLEGVVQASGAAAAQDPLTVAAPSGGRIDTGEGPRGRADASAQSPEVPPVVGVSQTPESERAARARAELELRQRELEDLSRLYSLRDGIAHGTSTGNLDKVQRDIEAASSHLLFQMYQARVAEEGSRIQNNQPGERKSRHGVVR